MWRRRCSEPATTAAARAVKLAAAATVKQSSATVRPRGVRGSERVGVRKLSGQRREQMGAPLEQCGGGVGGKPVEDGSVEAADATVSGTGHGMGRRERHLI